MTPASLSTSSSNAHPGPNRSANKAWKFPIAALAALVLVAGFEGVVWKNRYKFWDVYKVLGDHKRKALASKSDRCDIAIFGVSRFYHIDPHALQQVFGSDKAIRNFSWRWSGVEAYEAALHTLIRVEKIPTTIIVDGMPEILGYRLEHVSAVYSSNFQEGIGEMVPAIDRIRVSAGMRAFGWTWAIISGFLTPPSMKDRKGVVDAISEFKASGEWPTLPSDYGRVVIKWQRDGWFVFAAGKQASADDFETLEKLTGPYRLYPNHQALANYERFIRLCNDYNIEVIMLPVPSNPLLYNRYKEEGVFVEYDRWLNTVERQYSNFKALTPRWFTWPEALGDAGHVHEAGAERHMELVLELLPERH